jgi:hypothetical protein
MEVPEITPRLWQREKGKAEGQGVRARIKQRREFAPLVVAGIIAENRLA